MANSSNYYIAGAFLLICMVTIWKSSHPSGSTSSGFDEQKIDDILREIQALKRMQAMEGKSYAIEKRLEEANENWKRGLEARKELESKNLLDQNNPWNYKNGISIWDFFYPNFDCPHTVERIGKSGDGGKWICGFSHLAKKPDPCIVYSYGVSTDTSFEDEIVARTNCSVYLFDHTINTNKVQLPKRHPNRVFIEKVGLGVTDTEKLRSIPSTMTKYGHNFIDILKVDVEGAEFEVFDSFKTDFPDDLPFGQVSIEIHLNGRITNNFFKKYKTWLSNLEDLGLRAFKNEFNLISVRRSSTHYPTLCEYSFLNIKNPNNYLLQE